MAENYKIYRDDVLIKTYLDLNNIPPHHRTDREKHNIKLIYKELKSRLKQVKKQIKLYGGAI